MKQFIFIILLFAAGIIVAVENPNLASPVGSPTAVPSAARRGLIPSQPYDAFSSQHNRTAAGNRDFRNFVPYGTGLHPGDLGLGPVDAYLWHASDPLVGNRAAGQFRRYYDPLQSMTSVVYPDGRSSLSHYRSVSRQPPDYRQPGQSRVRSIESDQDIAYADYLDHSRSRPLSLSAAETERILARQMMLREEMQQQRDRRDEESDEDADSRIDLRMSDSLFFQDYLKPVDTRQDTERRPLDEDETQAVAEKDEYERIFETIRDDIQAEEQDDATDPFQRRPRQTDWQQSGGEEPAREDDRPLLSETDKAQAAALLSRYGSFEKLAAARVAEYLAAGETFLKEGRFYKAADTFALAVLWAPQDARPLAGQSFALFAAGEYMSSAFYLAQAIERNADVARQRVDLAGLIGDRDTFEDRVIEMTTWQERSGAGELAFMAAFVHYHDGKPGRAAEAIRIAEEKMPDSNAVHVLKEVIRSAQ